MQYTNSLIDFYYFSLMNLLFCFLRLVPSFWIFECLAYERLSIFLHCCAWRHGFLWLINLLSTLNLDDSIKLCYWSLNGLNLYFIVFLLLGISLILVIVGSGAGNQSLALFLFSRSWNLWKALGFFRCYCIEILTILRLVLKGLAIYLLNWVLILTTKYYFVLKFLFSGSNLLI